MNDHLLLDKLTLHVKIDDESQIFSDYAYNEDNLNPEFSSYLIEKAEHIYPLPPKENFIIKIHTENPHLRRHEVRRCIHRHFHDAYNDELHKKRHNTRSALALFGLGLLALILYFVAEVYVGNFFLSEILDVATWVFMWGAIEVIVLERYSIRRSCTLLRRLAFAEVVISNGSKLEAPVYS